MIQNQIVPVGNLHGDDSEYPEDDHNGTEPWDAPVFEFKISTLADLTGHKDIKMGGAFALVEYWDSAQSEKPDFLAAPLPIENRKKSTFADFERLSMDVQKQTVKLEGEVQNARRASKELDGAKLAGLQAPKEA